MTIRNGAGAGPDGSGARLAKIQIGDRDTLQVSPQSHNLQFTSSRAVCAATSRRGYLSDLAEKMKVLLQKHLGAAP